MKNDYSEEKARKSLKSSKTVILITNIIAAVLFLFAYSLTGENWFLILGIALVLICILTVYLLKKLENRINSIYKKG